MVKKFLISAIIFAFSAPIWAKPTVELYRSENCACCLRWSKIMTQQGFQVKDHLVDDMEQIKAQYHIPKALESCHTAIIDGYIFEGHVPTADIHKLLKERPNDIRALAVKGMPAQAPGMGDPNQPPKDIQVMAIHSTGPATLYHSY
ncbi:DUF411 domain-containing protein [Celerinatantimonas sp. MCCC 1A17872]|uniref:DUF411 domain-containing protein n=1 Tax=Celerinatantimonas sp. MCCC 1A17872 TaxID=3177514 RepID=UPI0038CB1A8F